jgi:hypothetical protein
VKEEIYVLESLRKPIAKVRHDRENGDLSGHAVPCKANVHIYGHIRLFSPLDKPSSDQSLHPISLI